MRPLAELTHRRILLPFCIDWRCSRVGPESQPTGGEKCSAAAFGVASWAAYAGGIEAAFYWASLWGLSFPPSELAIQGIHVVLVGGLLGWIAVLGANCPGQ